MTNEKMLELVNGMIAAGGFADLKTLMETKEKLIADIRVSEAKKSGCADIQKAATAIIKDAKKNSPERAAIHGSWTYTDDYGNEYQCVCNGYLALRIFDAVPLEKIDLDKCLPFDISKVMTTEWMDSCDKELDLPSKQELAAYIKTADKDANGNVVYYFGEKMPVVNAKYLKIMIDGIENPKAAYCDLVHGIHIYGDNADAILLPIRKK